MEPLSIGFVSVAARESYRASDMLSFQIFEVRESRFYLSVCSCFENISTFIHTHTYIYIYIYTSSWHGPSTAQGPHMSRAKGRTGSAQGLPQVRTMSAQKLISFLKMTLLLKRICFKSSVVFPLLNSSNLFSKTKLVLQWICFKQFADTHTHTHAQKQSYIQTHTYTQFIYTYIYITDLMRTRSAQGLPKVRTRSAQKQ